MNNFERSIEEKIGISTGMKDDFRREIMNYMGGLAAKGKEFRYDSNEQLYKALEKKLFEDTKDSNQVVCSCSRYCNCC